MDGFAPYFGWAILIVVVALVTVYLKKNGIFVRHIKHGKAKVDLEFKSIEEKLEDNEKDQNECDNIDRRESYKILKIFLGSPSGLEIYRDKFCDEVDFFSRTHAERRNVIFRVKKWEDIPTGYGRPQSIINEDLATCKGYVLLLHDRWGSPPGDSGGRSFSSGSEEEFRIAEEMIKKKQMHKLGVYFKSVDPKRLQSPDEQLAKVLEFNRWLRSEHVLLYNEFTNESEFREKVHKFMTDWLEEIAPWRRPGRVESVFDYEKL